MRNRLVAPVWFLAGLLATLSGSAWAQDTQFDGVSEAARINVMLAESYLREGDLAAAYDKAGRAVRRDPKSAQAHAVMAMVFDRMDRQKKAAESFARAVKLAAETGAIRNAFAVWHCQHGRFTDAEAEFAQALADPLYKLKAQSLRNAGKCAFLGKDMESAERHYRALLAVSPEDAAALESLAYIHLEKGDLLRARAFIQRRDALGQPSAEMLDLAAKIEEASGESAAARGYRRRAQELFPDTKPPNGEGARQP